MQPREGDRAFVATVAQVYESHLVPLLFEPYAVMVAERAAALAPERVLEIAAGTGVLTRALSARAPATATITASDLNQAMLDRARGAGTPRPVEWKQADALNLPFADASFDLVVCEFGAMFFPDKPRAFAEARRVLVPGGTLMLAVWDSLETNELPEIVDVALAAQFPDDPPAFMRRTPHGYFDERVIEGDLKAGGFTSQPTFETLSARSPADSAGFVATAFCEGTPLRLEIEARAPGALGAVTRAVEAALKQRFGDKPVDGKTQARLVSVVS